MQFSIIVPVYNEAPLIRRFLQQLRERTPDAEIIVADGKSSDGTADLAAGLCDQLVVSEPNRAAQMNVGARASTGDVLWFVHVDVEVPQECLSETDSFAHYAGILLRMRCGDHGIFCRRSAFTKVGGFPEVPLMEDVEFFRRLRRCGRVRHSDKRIMISARRYEMIGRARLTLAYGLIATLYTLGVPLSVLARIYRRICCIASDGR
ncbi:MAG: hypothetical protein DME94_02650 [Verrucomicrobia bacterium]|nr:MAG: hypothetical protein DME94_02650 [Verrucomicrobiota bacterium]